MLVILNHRTVYLVMTMATHILHSLMMTMTLGTLRRAAIPNSEKRTIEKMTIISLGIRMYMIWSSIVLARVRYLIP